MCVLLSKILSRAILVPVKGILFSFLSLILTLGAPSAVPFESSWTADYNYVLSRAASSPYAERIASCVVRYSYRYQLLPGLVANVIATESNYKHTACSPGYYARGLMQVRSYHDHLLYKVDNGRLGRYLLKNDITNFNRYWYRIGYNIEAGCIILSSLISKYGVGRGLLAYNRGEYSLKFKMSETNPKLWQEDDYVKSILE